jgi:hypothetical protein
MPGMKRTLLFTGLPATLRHFQALVRLDTTNPPGNQTRAVEYLTKGSAT